MAKRRLMFVLALAACFVPVCGYALPINLSLFSGGLSVLDSLFLISSGLILIGILLMCIAFTKPEKKILTETEISETSDDFKDEPEAAEEEEQGESAEEQKATDEAEAEFSEENTEENSEQQENESESETEQETDEESAEDEDNKESETEEEVQPEINVTLTLTGVENGELKVLPLSDRAVIGRSMRNDIVITDSTVSGVHCEFTYENEKLYLTDKNSTNGTYINGERIAEKTEVHKGDILEIGRNKFKIGI